MSTAAGPQGGDDLGDDLFAMLGVTIPEGPAKTKKTKAPRGEPIRHTNWVEGKSFTFTGYVARVWRYTCICCETETDVLEGVFMEEVHKASGTRQLLGLAPKGDWPAKGGHRLELTVRPVGYCGYCIRGLGFDQEVGGEAGGTAAEAPAGESTGA